MAGFLRVIGVHPIPADEPVHLLEIEINGDAVPFDFGKITQEIADQPRQNWQAPFDEREVSREGGSIRVAFFFHYLDLRKPLFTPFGTVPLPAESTIPKHLSAIEYEQP